jgi:hypothetical protein
LWMAIFWFNATTHHIGVRSWIVVRTHTRYQLWQLPPLPPPVSFPLSLLRTLHIEYEKYESILIGCTTGQWNSVSELWILVPELWMRAYFHITFLPTIEAKRKAVISLLMNMTDYNWNKALWER